MLCLCLPNFLQMVKWVEIRKRKPIGVTESENACGIFPGSGFPLKRDFF